MEEEGASCGKTPEVVGEGGRNAPAAAAESVETKVIYHIDEEDTPYLVKIPKPGASVRLCDFKTVLPSHLQKYKYFFKSKDDDFGVVKEEIVDEQSPLPLFNGRVVSWLVAAEGSVVGALSDVSDHHRRTDADVASSVLLPYGLERSSGVGQTRPPSFHGTKSRSNGRRNLLQGVVDVSVTNTETDSLLSSRQDGEDLYDGTESSITSVSQLARGNRQSELQRNQRRGYRPPRLPGPGIQGPSGGSASVVGLQATATETCSMMSSEIESSLYDDTEDMQSMASSRFTTSTDHTSVSRNAINLRHRQKKRSRRKVPAHLARAGSISSVTDSTMSLNIITVTLNMDTVNFLGISIVGQSNKFGDGDCGIYVGSIMKGGAVALDGRIEPGDMILQVNDTNFENMSNDDAVKVLREVVQKPGPIKLVVAKCWDPTPSKGYISMPRTEPVRPIDPGAWVAHTAAVRAIDPPLPPESFLADEPHHFSGQSQEYLLLAGDYPGRARSVTTLSESSIVSSQPETEKYFPHKLPQHVGVAANQLPLAVGTMMQTLPLTTNSGMLAITEAMKKADSGLEVRDRVWLKIKIPKAFLGSDIVDWLYEKVDGYQDRRDARKYATQMLKAGLIKHTVKKTTFSEQCYYAFEEDCARVSQLNLNDSRGSGDSALPSYPMLSNDNAECKGAGRLPPSSAPGEFVMPWAGPTSGGGGGSGSNTTYGPVYIPSAPPPSANYSSMPPPYLAYPGINYHHQQRSVSSSGSSHRSNIRNLENLRLAGSGSGSESVSDGGRDSGSTLGGSLNHGQQNRGVLRNVLPPPATGSSSWAI